MTVPWGKSLRLAGKSTFPGTPVNVAERVPGGGADWAQVATTEAAADGSFAVELKPERGAQYRAQVAADQVARRRCGSRSSRSLTFRALAKRAKIGRQGHDRLPGDAAAGGDDARPAAPRRASRPLADDAAQAGHEGRPRRPSSGRP